MTITYFRQHGQVQCKQCMAYVLSKEGLSTMIKMTSGGELYRIHFHNNHSLLLTVLITVVPPVLLETQNEVSSFY